MVCFLLQPIFSIAERKGAKRWAEKMDKVDDWRAASVERPNPEASVPSSFSAAQKKVNMTLDTDTQDEQAGCVLNEKIYDTTDKERVGVNWAVLLLRSYLESALITVHTDQDASRWIIKYCLRHGSCTLTTRIIWARTRGRSLERNKTLRNRLTFSIENIRNL